MVYEAKNNKPQSFNFDRHSFRKIWLWRDTISSKSDHPRFILMKMLFSWVLDLHF